MASATDKIESIARARGASSDGGPWGLTVLFSPDEKALGRAFVLNKKFSIGREARVGFDIEVDDRRISRQHCTVQRGTDGFTVSDAGSTNGTFANGARVTSLLLARGDVLRVGDTVFELNQISTAPAPPAGDSLIGHSPIWRAVIDHVDRFAPTALPILILGESGTGKELIAQRVHTVSRRSGAFVAVNCSALQDNLAEATIFGHRRGAFTGAVQDTQGLVARASGGTLFLDELGDLPLALQPKLLRVLESGEYTPVGATAAEHADLRIVSATNRSLQADMASGAFRGDLYARVAGAVISLLPLRERRADIPLIARHFLAEADCHAAFTADFVERLVTHSWTLNVRELKFVMKRLAITHDDGELTGDDAAAALTENQPPPVKAVFAPAQKPSVPTRAQLLDAIKEADGNISLLATRYGRNRRQIYRWLEKLGIPVENIR